MDEPEPFIAGEFFFDPDDTIYREHFPMNPVVPGSLIIEAFMRVAQPALEGTGEILAVENFRFRHFISPGRYAFRVAMKSDGTMQCVLYDGGRTAVTGILSGPVVSC